MGAGYGFTGNAQIRVATENFQFAMPEARFGLNADIGCAHMLTKNCPEHIATYLTLTADRIRGGFDDGLWSGVCTDYVPSSQLPSLFHTLLRSTTEYFLEIEHSSPSQDQNVNITKNSNKLNSQLIMLLKTIVSTAFSTQKTKTKPSRLQRLYPNIKRIFGLQSIAEIYDALKNWTPTDTSPTSTAQLDDPAAEEAEWIKFCLNAFERDCCPMSMAANFEAMKRAKNKTFTYADSLINDYRVAVRISLRKDILLGAQGILQKTGPPQWNPSSVMQVSAEEVDRLYASLGAYPTETVKSDLELPGPYPC